MKNRFSFELQGILKQLLFCAHAKLSILIYRTYLEKALEVDYKIIFIRLWRRKKFGKERRRMRYSAQQIKNCLEYIPNPMVYEGFVEKLIGGLIRNSM